MNINIKERRTVVNDLRRNTATIFCTILTFMVGLNVVNGNQKPGWDGSLTAKEIETELLSIVPIGSKFESVEKLLSKERPAISFNIVKDAMTMHPQSKKQQLMERAIFATLAEVASAPESPVAEVTSAFFLFKEGKLIEVSVWKSLSGP